MPPRWGWDAGGNQFSGGFTPGYGQDARAGAVEFCFSTKHGEIFSDRINGINRIQFKDTRT